MVKPALHSEKGGANIMRALFLSKNYKRINYDACRMMRYNLNILQWNGNYMKSRKTTTGDFGDPAEQINFNADCNLKIAINELV